MRRMTIAGLALFLATTAFAQAPRPDATPGPTPRERGPMHGPMGGPMGGHLEKFLYPPDLVLSNQIALGLTEDQIAAIKKQIGETHDVSLDVQTRLRRVTEQLHAALEPSKVDEAAALELAAEAMGLERQIKSAHLKLMIRVKNVLTSEQQETLKALRSERTPRSYSPAPL